MPPRFSPFNRAARGAHEQRTAEARAAALEVLRDAHRETSGRRGAVETLLATTVYRFSTLSVGLLGLLLIAATIQAPINTLALGGSLERSQTISASVADWNSPQGRLFFALCGFGALLNMMSLHPFWLTPPVEREVSGAWLLRGLRAIGRCTGSADDTTPAAWPLGLHGTLRFAWLAAQSLGLFLLASVNYATAPDGLADATASVAITRQQDYHNLGAALAFIVSFTAEVVVLAASARMGRPELRSRRVFAECGLVCAALFLYTQVGTGCTGDVAPTVCRAPWGTVSYASEVGMCLSLALGFLATARSQRVVLEAALRGPPPSAAGAAQPAGYMTLTSEARAWQLL
jgi:hypothetical protein